MKISRFFLKKVENEGKWDMQEWEMEESWERNIQLARIRTKFEGKDDEGQNDTEIYKNLENLDTIDVDT